MDNNHIFLIEFICYLAICKICHEMWNRFYLILLFTTDIMPIYLLQCWVNDQSPANRERNNIEVNEEIQKIIDQGEVFLVKIMLLCLHAIKAIVS